MQLQRTIGLLTAERALCGLLVAVSVVSCRPRPVGWAKVDTHLAETFPGLPMVTTAELAAWLAAAERQPLLLLDVRSHDEYAVSHLTGARHCPPGSGPSDIGPIPDGATVVFYCSVGYRSAQMASDWRQRGIENAYNLSGSIFAWANEGRPLYRGTKAVSVVHPFDSHWGALLDAKYHSQ